MASYGSTLPPGFAVDQPQQQAAPSTYGAQLPAGFTADAPQQAPNAFAGTSGSGAGGQQQPVNPLDENIVLPFLPGAPSVNLGDVASFANHLGDTASLGLAPALMRTIQNAVVPGSGDATAAKVQAVNEQHPLGAAAGDVAAIPVDAMLTAPIGGAAEAVPALKTLASGGGIIGDLGRLATTGAVEGGVNAVTHGGDPTTGAVTGAVAGTVVGTAAKPLISATANALGPTAIRAWRYLAGKLGEDPDQMLAHVQDFTQRTGQQPSLQQVVSDHDAGVIANFGKQQPAAGQVLREGAQASENALPQQAQAIIDSGRSNNAGVSDLINARKAQMDAGMGTQGPTPNLLTGPGAPGSPTAALRDQPVQINIPANDVRAIMQRLPASEREVLNNTFSIGNDGSISGRFTLGDVDTLRRDLNGSATGLNTLGKQAYSQLSDQLAQQARVQYPAYGKLLDNYAAQSNFIDGFTHGTTGRAMNAATDNGTVAALATPEGQQGYRAGYMSQLSQKAGGTPSEAGGVLGDISRPGTAQQQFQQAGGTQAQQDAAAALRTASQRTRSSAPGSLTPQADSHAAGAQMATAVAEAPFSPHGSLWRGVRAAAQLAHGAGFSPQDATTVARHLVSADPADRARGLRMLRVGGASQTQIKLAQSLAAAMGARAATNYQGAQ